MAYIVCAQRHTDSLRGNSNSKGLIIYHQVRVPLHKLRALQTSFILVMKTWQEKQLKPAFGTRWFIFLSYFLLVLSDSVVAALSKSSSDGEIQFTAGGKLPVS